MKLKQLTSAVILATTGMSATAATYTLTPTPAQDLSFANYAQSIDNSGTLVINTSVEYNPPIDLSLFDFENELFTAQFEDPDAVEQGVFSNVDYNILYSYVLQVRQSSILGQKLETLRSYQTDMVGLDLIPGFDVYSEDFDDYSRSSLSLIRDSLNGDFFVGTGNGAFFELDYTNEDGTDYTFIINALPKQAIV